MGVRGDGEGNSLLDGETNNSVRRIKLFHRFTPTSGRQFHREIAGTNQPQCIVHQLCDWPARAVPMDFHQIEVGQTIHQATRSDFADTAKIIGVNFINVAFGKLLGSGWYTVEHLIGLAEVMNRAENEIESIPIL